MRLGKDIAFEELYARDGLIRLDAAFAAGLKSGDTALYNRLMAARAEPHALSDKEHSQLLLDLAPHAEDFIAALFDIEKEMRALAEKHHLLAPLYACKRLFVQRRATKMLTPEAAARVDGDQLLGLLPLAPVGDEHFELVFAKVVMSWLAEEEKHKSLLEVAGRYAAWALYSEQGRARHAKGILFRQPKKTDPLNLIPVETEERDGVQLLRLPREHLRPRDGFKLTDDAGPLAAALDHTHYCIFCHHQGKDSCSRGLKEKGIGDSALGIREDTSNPQSPIPNPAFKKSALGITLAGCPLEEKISEMNELKSGGVPLGALAVVVVDNPMCAGTGHRICNDCMKSCIYQKQEPVNIPLAETHVLKDILELPYGFEIYSLLTRWNPLNLARPIPREDSGCKVLVAGLGPAGYTLAHHLLNDGHTVVGIDGLKIEPVEEKISGVTALGARVAFAPIRDITTLYEALDERALAGFGGVAEYGITVRWNKNYLKIIRLLLERRQAFSMLGGMRFGSQITYDSAFALGFDHIALCMGAGSPTLIAMKNGVARGVRAASDFLMALQLTGAAKKDSIANLQLRLPAVVIGGGLTAIDTATEALAYYPVQVEKFLARYEALVHERGADAVRKHWDAEEKQIAEEFLAHGKAIRNERQKAKKEGRAPDFWPLLDRWGGVKIVYRKRLIDAPSYRLNHEEVEKAFEEGMFFSELLEPVGVELDQWGHAEKIRLKKVSFNPAPFEGEGSVGGRTTYKNVGSDSIMTTPPPNPLPQGEGEIILSARTILVAAGTQPNTVLAREEPEHFTLDGKFFRAVDEEGKPVTPERISKANPARVLMSLDAQGRAVSFFGDLHPSFNGNVVKAMASARQGYQVVSAALARRSGHRPAAGGQFIEKINQQLRATVHEVKRLTPKIVEVVVKAPSAAQQFQPGQFFRLQNYEIFALKLAAGRWPLTTTLAMEGLAMTGAWVDKEKGLVSLIVLEMGGSSDLCAYLKPGEPVVLMGPTGTPTEIRDKETVLLAGGGLGNAVLFSIGKAMRARGCKVLYFAGYRKAGDRYHVGDIEAAADQVVWCCDETLLAPGRPQDASFHGNIVEAMRAYGAGKMESGILNLESQKGKSVPDSRFQIPLNEVQRLIAIGSDKMMAAIADARRGALKSYLNSKHVAIASINSPMQCMMKEICAQCLQKHVDPNTGKESYVYSCFNQDQSLETVAFSHLSERLRQNSLQEKLTAQWVDYCLKGLELRDRSGAA